MLIPVCISQGDESFAYNYDTKTSAFFNDDGSPVCDDFPEDILRMAAEVIMRVFGFDEENVSTVVTIPKEILERIQKSKKQL